MISVCTEKYLFKEIVFVGKLYKELSKILCRFNYVKQKVIYLIKRVNLF